MSGATTQTSLEKNALRARNWKALAIRLSVTAAALMIWFWTQSLIGARSQPSAGIADSVHEATSSLNGYLHARPAAANALLIVSSAIIDLLGIFLLCLWIFGASPRPFFALVLVLGLRQIMQALVALPAPSNAIWHYPGFPSLLVTYGVSNDYFFSGHTAIAVLGASEIARLRRGWLTGLGFLIVIFEIATVLVLRAHYTVDVFTGVVTGLYATHLASRLSDFSSSRVSAVF